VFAFDDGKTYKPFHLQYLGHQDHGFLWHRLTPKDGQAQPVCRGSRWPRALWFPTAHID